MALAIANGEQRSPCFQKRATEEHLAEATVYVASEAVTKVRVGERFVDSPHRFELIAHRLFLRRCRSLDVHKTKVEVWAIDIEQECHLWAPGRQKRPIVVSGLS